MSALFERLKAGTADEHRAIEGVVPLLDERLDAGAYVAHLQRMLGFLVVVEDAIVARVPSFAARRRSEALKSDLRALGESVDVAVVDDAAFVDSDAAAWGAAYVLEGSRLGGQIIARRIGDRFGAATSWLTGVGKDTGAHWKAFKVEAEAALGKDGAVSDADVDAAVAAASACFVALRLWLTAGASAVRETAPTTSLHR